MSNLWSRGCPNSLNLSSRIPAAGLAGHDADNTSSNTVAAVIIFYSSNMSTAAFESIAMRSRELEDRQEIGQKLGEGIFERIFRDLENMDAVEGSKQERE